MTLQNQVWLEKDSGDFNDFTSLVEQNWMLEQSPHAMDVEKNIPIYDGESLSGITDKRALLAEFAMVLRDGPGIIVIKNGISGAAVVDQATQVFDEIIANQHANGTAAGDHFAKPGSNDRVWNAVEKHCLADPENFAKYYATDAIALPCQAWLGPGYQVTAQVNRVNPGGGAQVPHRDYHLGFMSPDQMVQYPAHIHGISPVLTLQGAVAHCDMPVESGPTMLLPFSQAFFEGYLAFGRAEYQKYFAKNHVQLPLEKGDVMFFNPAVMHGAGNNTSADIYRLANLLQVSSAFGRSTEAVDRVKMSKHLYPVLALGNYDGKALNNIIAASAEGYAFPTNLDRNPPVAGLAPPSQADLMRDALSQNMGTAEFSALMDEFAQKQLT